VEGGAPLQPAHSAGDWAWMSFDLLCNATCVNSCRIYSDAHNIGRYNKSGYDPITIHSLIWTVNRSFSMRLTGYETWAVLTTLLLSSVIFTSAVRKTPTRWTEHDRRWSMERPTRLLDRKSETRATETCGLLSREQTRRTIRTLSERCTHGLLPGKWRRRPRFHILLSPCPVRVGNVTNGWLVNWDLTALSAQMGYIVPLEKYTLHTVIAKPGDATVHMK